MRDHESSIDDFNIDYGESDSSASEIENGDILPSESVDSGNAQ